MARVMAADGVTLVAATPHVRDDFPTPVDVVEDGVRELRAALADAGFPGVEVELRQAGDGERASTFAPPAAPAPHAPLARALAARRTSITGVDTYA